MSELETINIRPESGILAILSHLNYKPWFALAEFVDNALQSTKLAIAGHSRAKVEDRYNHASEEAKRDWILRAWNAGVVSAYDKPEAKTATEVAV